MTDYFVVFGDFLVALPTYLLNGILATVYWLGESGAALVCILCAGLIIRFVDQRVQSRAAFRPGRSGREAATPNLYTAQISTAFILAMWVVSQWGMGAPVPWLGAAMWLTGTIIVLLVHMQEHTLALEYEIRHCDLFPGGYWQSALPGIHCSIIRRSVGCPDRHFRKRRGCNCQYSR